MEKLVKSKIYEKVRDDSKERLLFAIFAFLGGIIILCLRSLNDALVSSFFINMIIALIAVSFIIIYGFIILKQLNLVGNALDRSSDNAYYLGLLYTLYSLVYALIKFVSQVDPSGNITGSNNVLVLLPDFGVALLSTIAGIGMRVWMQQFNTDPGTVDNEARQELGRMLSDIKSSMIRFQGDLNTLSSTYNTSTEELNKRVSKTLADAAQIHADTIKKVSSDLVDLAEENKKQIETIGSSTLKISESLEDSANTLKVSFNDITTSIKGNLENFSERLDNSSSKISEVVGKIDNAASQINETVNTLKAINLKENEIKTGFSNIAQGVKDTLPSIIDANKNMKEISNLFEMTKKNVEEPLQDISNGAENINTSSKAIKKSTDEYIKTLSETTEKLNDATKKNL